MSSERRHQQGQHPESRVPSKSWDGSSGVGQTDHHARDFLAMVSTQLGLHPEELVVYVLNLAVLFELPPVLSETPIVVVDPGDDMFISCAIAAGALYLVSGDHHLLDLKRYIGISILTLRMTMPNISLALVNK